MRRTGVLSQRLEHNVARLLITQHIPHAIRRHHDELVTVGQLVHKQIRLSADQVLLARPLLVLDVAKRPGTLEEVGTVRRHNATIVHLAAKRRDARGLLGIVRLVVVSQRRAHAGAADGRARVARVCNVQRIAPDQHRHRRRPRLIALALSSCIGHEIVARDVERLAHCSTNVARRKLTLRHHRLVQHVLRVLRNVLATVPVVHAREKVACRQLHHNLPILHVAAITLELVHAHSQLRRQPLGRLPRLLAPCRLLSTLFSDLGGLDLASRVGLRLLLRLHLRPLLLLALLLRLPLRRRLRIAAATTTATGAAATAAAAIANVLAGRCTRLGS